jgi:hypothetical protein
VGLDAAQPAGRRVAPRSRRGPRHEGHAGDGAQVRDINDAANSIGNAILANLLVQRAARLLPQGDRDPVLPADVQALGALYLDARGDGRAKQVAEYLRQRFYVAPRASSVGTLSGYRPFVGPGTPDVIWSEGTLETATTFHRLDVDATAADTAVAQIVATLGGRSVGPPVPTGTWSTPVWASSTLWSTSAAASCS